MANEDLQDFAGRIRLLPLPARKLLCVIARQIHHGALRSKDPGIATMPEIHEACGLDVDEMYSVLQVLRHARLIELEGQYPFEEIRMSGGAETIVKRCDAARILLEDVLVEFRFDRLA